MKKFLAYCFSIAVIVFVAKAQALSCSCVDMGDSLESKVADWSRSSAAAFSGKVINREPVEGTIEVIYTFSVGEVWKGPVVPTIEIRERGSSCSFGFKVGATYLVYAVKDSVFLRSAACTGITERDSPEGKNQIKFLGKGKIPAKADPAKDGSN